MKINPNDPAAPVLILGEDMRLEAQHKGMPIRLAIAAQFMAAAVASKGLRSYDGRELLAKTALGHADALIQAYNDSEK